LAVAVAILVNPPRPATAQNSITHIVQPGDTLLDLELFYHTPLHELSSLNDLDPGTGIGAGQELTIPVPLSLEALPREDPITYTVQRGDTLFRIATRYGVSMVSLASVNAIYNIDTIYIGQELVIPPSDEWAEQIIQNSPNLPGVPTPTLSTGKQIIVVLSQQRVYAFEDGALLRQFVVSTGLPATPTVVGSFSIYLKVPSQRMTGPGYDLPNVPWVMYFYRGYSFHGTYWHNNFGRPMSHGCVNMRTAEAEWLYNWAPIGTSVLVIR
jgi:lipoprotein-anchoring transpeptidase ErfK/SrfK